MREQAEGAWVAWRGAAEIMGPAVRGTDRQRGETKQQEGQQTSEC